MAMKTKAKPDEILTADQAAEFLKVGLDTLLSETAAGRVPARSLAGEYRYSRRALLRWIRTGTVRPDRPASPPLSASWTPEKDRAVEAEIAEMYTHRRSLGTVGELQDGVGGP